VNLKLTHIINPVKVKSASDLFIAQPITFESLKRAKTFASNEVQIDLIATQFPEDHSIIPPYITKVQDLDRSILDYGNFRSGKKLPFLKDILDRAFEHAESGDYIIYTNIDISLQPYFYLAVRDLIDNHYDALVINRRTISSQYLKEDKLSLMWSEVGDSHPGRDCFVFNRDIYQEFILDDVCIGAPMVGRVLQANMQAFSAKFGFLKNQHLTYHIGDDREWENDSNKDITLFNYIQAMSALTKLQKKVSNKTDWEGYDTANIIKKYLETHFK
jgi:hypothetical protein